MAKNKAKNKKQSKRNTLQAMSQIVPKATSMLRADVALWKSARGQAENPDNQRMYAIHNLYKEIEIDARLSSQTKTRKEKGIGGGYSIKDANDKVLDDLTQTCLKSGFFNDIVANVWDKIIKGHTVLEFDYNDDAEKYQCYLIPRQNIVPNEGFILKDYNDDKGIKYREEPEYGNWIVEFGDHYDYGLLNKAIPHVLFKRFAQSCWSELCEIYGIPPRVMKTNTADTAALHRAEKMMQEMGAAAWFIIDDTEDIEWAQSVNTSGEVYENLINLCNNEICLLLTGALIGQDSKYGSKGKEQSSLEVLDSVVQGDKRMIERIMCDVIMHALYLIGFLPADGLRFEWDKAENLGELWTRTKEILPYKKVKDDWIKDKFGIEVEGDIDKGSNELNIAPDFFV